MTLEAMVIAHPIPAMKHIERLSFFCRESCNRNTPVMGKTIIYTSDTNAHAAKGTESFLPMLECDVV